jgi:regulator of sigma E protease
MLAWLIFWGANFFQGKPITPTTTIAYVEDGSPASLAGFVTGDKILSVNGKKLTNWEDVRAEIFINTLGENINIEVLRAGEEKDIIVERKLIPDDETQAMFLVPEGVKPAIGEVVKDSPAEKAGIKAGDILLSLNGVSLYSAKQTTEIISANPEKEMQLVVQRDKKEVNIAVTPGEDAKIGVAIGPVFMGESKMRKYGAFESVYYGWKDIEKMTALTFSMIGKVFTGDVEFKKAFGGPIKIAQIAAKSADSGISNFLYFLALLSLSLAILNIMPFPVLDGGHLVMIIVEAVIKREIPIKIKMAIQNTGLVLLLLLMAFIIYNDIISL